jgi:hypothetical protein
MNWTNPRQTLKEKWHELPTMTDCTPTATPTFDYTAVTQLPAIFSFERIILCNSSRKIADNPLTIKMDPQAWSYGVGISANPFYLREYHGPMMVHLNIIVEEAEIGVGALNKHGSSYIGEEIQVAPDTGVVQTITLNIPSVDQLSQVMIRTGILNGVAPIVKIHSVEAWEATVERSATVTEVACPNIVNELFNKNCDPSLDSIKILISHTSRVFDAIKCDQDFLKKRYSREDRLADITPFEKLPPRPSPPLYYGNFTIAQLRVVDGQLALNPLRCFDTRDNIAHACLVGDKFVLCFENYLYVMDSLDAPIDGLIIESGDPNLITDNWFCDLHTVFPIDETTCLVSGSCADAVFWVDIPKRKVIKRWRLPEETYGSNYDLQPNMSIHDHFIDNEKQLGHLNCAYPDGAGGCVVSVLGQGDIGHLNAAGEYELLAHGYVGSQGSRCATDGSYVYFASSCTGQLFKVDQNRQVEEVITIKSQWLQDVTQIKDDVFAFAAKDWNELAIIDTKQKRELGRFKLSSRGNGVVFLGVIPS